MHTPDLRIAQLPDDVIEKMVIAQWNAIPAHIDYHEYMTKHPRRVEIRAALIKHMRAAVDALHLALG